MKKIFTTMLVLAIGYSGFAQTQRMVLAEEFTQASCGPCAAQNPTYNALMQANTSKVICLKYQTSWPGVDPMNAQNQSDVQTRVDYYGVNGVPYSPMDGDTMQLITGGYYTGAPHNWDQTKIDAEYSIPAPVAISATHYLSSDLDSIYIHITVTNATASTLSATNWKLRVALTEKTITFTTEPGTNGETEFYDVMRKMIPSAAGTAMSSLNAGATATFDFNVGLPSYIYNKAQLSVVAFVQEDNGTSSHYVEQAAISLPQQIPANNNYTDAGAVNQTSAPTGGLCDNHFTPQVQISNNFSTVITSADVSYTLNGGTPVTQPWTGNLAQGQTATVSFPQATANAGTNVISGSVSNINSGSATDYNAQNNTTSDVTFATIPSAPFDTKIVEGFESVAVAGQPQHTILSLPTATNGGVWAVDNTVATGVTWNLGAYENSSKSYRWRFYTIQSGNFPLIFEKIDLTGKSNVGLVFSYAYAQYTTENDELKIAVSTNCGSTWTTVWDKSGSSLSTSAASSSAFYPHAANWKTESVSLSQFNNTSDVMIKFEGISAFGNNLYVDDINLNSNVGVDEVNSNVEMGVFPNPASDNATVKFGLVKSSDVKLVVTNLMGQVVMEKELGKYVAGQFETSVDISTLPASVYKVSLFCGSDIQTQKLSVVR